MIDEYGAYLMRCDCGKHLVIRSNHTIMYNKQPSLPPAEFKLCYHTETNPIYWEWKRLKQRDGLCDKWIEDPADMIATVGEKPPGVRLRGMIRGTKVGPGNWIWSNEFGDLLKVGDIVDTQAGWAQRLGLTRQRVHQRLKMWMEGRCTLEQALSRQRRPISRKPKDVERIREAKSKRELAEETLLKQYGPLVDGQTHVVLSGESKLRYKMQRLAVKTGTSLSMRSLDDYHIVKFEKLD